MRSLRASVLVVPAFYRDPLHSAPSSALPRMFLSPFLRLPRPPSDTPLRMLPSPRLRSYRPLESSAPLGSPTYGNLRVPSSQQPRHPSDLQPYTSETYVQRGEGEWSTVRVPTPCAICINYQSRLNLDLGRQHRTPCARQSTRQYLSLLTSRLFNL
jgi:hypothetical protein